MATEKHCPPPFADFHDFASWAWPNYDRGEEVAKEVIRLIQSVGPIGQSSYILSQLVYEACQAGVIGFRQYRLAPENHIPVAPDLWADIQEMSKSNTEMRRLLAEWMRIKKRYSAGPNKKAENTAERNDKIRDLFAMGITDPQTIFSCIKEEREYLLRKGKKKRDGTYDLISVASMKKAFGKWPTNPSC